MTKYKLRILYQHYLAGTLTIQEQLEWKSLLADPNWKQTLEETVEEGWYDFSDEEMTLMDEIHADQIFDRVIAVSQKKTKQRVLWKPFVAAASVVILATLGLFLYKNTLLPKQKEFIANEAPILPGSNKAILTLADGKKIILSGNSIGNVARQNGVQITKQSNGMLVYEILPNQTEAINEDTKNSISTPVGGQFQVNLPDGTKVWLNAASSIQFSTALAKINERKIVLKGEAYFEVAKDKNRPFVVETTSDAGLIQRVEVLGTHFNINSYADEPATNTTLLEGKVRIHIANSSLGGRILAPGQQSILDYHGLKIKNVDVEDAIAWKNGFFSFENDNLGGILKKLSRWYDVEISYQGQLDHVKITGSISRNTVLQEILNSLEKTEKFKFKLKGRRIMVM